MSTITAPTADPRQSGLWSAGVARPAGAVMELDVEALYRRYGDMVLGRCRTLLGNDAEAQEACQEIFLRAHRYRRSFRGESSPSTFLYRITTNHCLNVLRSRRRKPEEALEHPDRVPDAHLDLVEIRQLLDTLLSGLDERTRECVVYRHVDGMTLREVGAMLDISEAAVRKRLKRFRAHVEANAPAWLGQEP